MQWLGYTVPDLRIRCFFGRGVVFMQVVPIGAGWLAEVCFANSARAMGLEYLEYRIGVEESSLTDKYGKNSLLIEDPATFRGEKWSSNVMDIYLKEQNVKLDLIRFREYLKEAYKKAKNVHGKRGLASFMYVAIEPMHCGYACCALAS
ncbi:hypothetical protein OIU84_019475 [Salix udensis]|uniref:Uncharacterized protein n=1 Tax=Salix udensis TaxID=889485 RepID=A0AAD6L0H5_9ROSI|nr:hypothetical protein OIU84_019475 [Salix udensis]